MVLICQEAQVEARFGPFVDSANPTYHRVKNHFWTHPMVLLGDVSHVETSVGSLGDGVSVGAR
jgi:transketolase N-terminal domain/subunit